MLLWRSLLVFTYQGRVWRYCSEPPLAFPWTEVSKAAQKANGGSGSAEIPLSVGSKLELLLGALVFAKFPYTSPYTHAFVHVCILPCIYTCIYVYIILAIYNVHDHDRGVEGFAL